MKLRSQELRKIAPNWTLCVWEPAGKLEDLSKPQIMIESTSGTATRAADICWNWWKRPEKEWPRPEDMGPDTLPRTSATGKPRDMTGSIIPLLPGI